MARRAEEVIPSILSKAAKSIQSKSLEVAARQVNDATSISLHFEMKDSLYFCEFVEWVIDNIKERHPSSYNANELTNFMMKFSSLIESFSRAIKSNEGLSFLKGSMEDMISLRFDATYLQHTARPMPFSLPSALEAFDSNDTSE